jgi:integrase
VRKLPSGTYQASYHHDGRRYWNTFDHKADADAWIALARTETSKGQWVDPDAGKLTVSELADLWRSSNPRKRSTTLARDEAIIRLHVLPTLGPRKLMSVNRLDIQNLIDHWSEGFTASTVVRHYATVRAIFTFAVDTDCLARTPCRRIRLPSASAVERPELRPDDLLRLADALGDGQAEMMWTGAVMGLRWAEVAALTVDHLDLLGGKILVDRQLNRDGALVEPKSRVGLGTSFACPEWLIEDLAALLKRRGLTAADGDAFVFVSPNGAPLHYANWRRRVWAVACDAAGLSGLGFHDLRSLNATALIRVGADVKTTQRRLRHSSARTTLDVYARATSEADREAADLLGSYLRPSSPSASAVHARALPVRKPLSK